MDTTLNIDGLLAEKIEKAAVDLSVSYSAVVRSIIRRMLRRRPARIVLFRRVRNQRVRPDGSWRRIHVIVPDDVYEQCMDMRKIWKRSVSAVFAAAVEDFLPQIVQGMLSKKEDDNSGSYSIRYQMNTANEYIIIINSHQKTTPG